ncbi:LysE family translocator [Lysobacter fragariae]
MHLFDTPTLLAYLATAAVLVVIPGPGTAWIVAQSAAGGTARGLRAGLGLETATLIHALAAGLGLSAVLATSALAFDVLKFAGAAYLVWLGIKAWRSSPSAPASDKGDLLEANIVDGKLVEADLFETNLVEIPGDVPGKPDPQLRGVYWRSVATGVLNPKVALFFLAFLPQFVHPERGLVWLQFLVLGALLSMIGFSNSAVLSVAVGHFGRRMGGNARFAAWRQRVLGTFFIGLGLRLALQQRS